ncbi:endonuclease domain-containing protein [Streptosporangium sp. NPDC051023]|uniref:endonuclease domain-containing protein n=1 Tax=Streptosporangium sp. NPDC051023 TaxID=3155410 RepID=UPI00344B6674
MPEIVGFPSVDPHDKCRHKHYRMTCEQFDALLVEAEGCCQVCRLPASHNSKQMLFIDHEAWRGDWAVRGLLCNTCNTILGKDLEVPRDEVFAAYLKNSWFIRMLATYGITPDLPPEPPIGSIVDFGGRQPQRMRTRKGWERVIHGYPWHSRTWRQLYRSYGPHRLNIIRVGDGKPLKQRSRYGRA